MRHNSGKYTYIDLFSGAGGMSLGFEQESFENVFSIDSDHSACMTYRRNFPDHTVLEKDISLLDENEIKYITGTKNIDVVIGGPPCQGFSIAGNIGRKFADDPRNLLFREYARIIGIVRPKCFVMENVARLYTHNGGNTREEILNTFRELGYSVDCKVVNTADYGVPQIRNRVLFIGNRLGTDNLFPAKNTEVYRTVAETIGDLPALESGQASDIPNHAAMRHSLQMLEKMRYVRDGGDRYDIPRMLRPATGDVRKYIRYSSTKPSVCITGDMRKVFHYSQNRALTVRELADIQTYPRDFVFEGTSISQQQQVGNSVPPLFARSIAAAINEMLYGKQ